MKSCAIVGNGDVLLNSRRGRDIDAMDVVIRVNRLPAVTDIEDLGWKSDVLVANHVVLETGVLNFTDGQSRTCINRSAACAVEAAMDFIVFKPFNKSFTREFVNEYWLRSPIPTTL